MVLFLVPLEVGICRRTRTIEGDQIPGDHQYILWTPYPEQLLLPLT